MSGFSPLWLAARDPWDRAAGAADLLADAAQNIATRNRGRSHGLTDQQRRIVDLGCGTGASARALTPALTPVLAGQIDWLLVDQDAALLAEAAETIRAQSATPDMRAETHHTDLAHADFASLLKGADLVTASALLDLVSEAWLADLWTAVRANGAGFLARLTYDGRIAFGPPHPLDATIRDLVNRHQRRDKGFGPALGPRAAFVLADRVRRDGWHLKTRRSDWNLTRPQAGAGLTMLIEGWAAAARAMAPGLTHKIDDWAAERLGSARLRVRVGHRDLLALPPGADRT